MVVKQSLEEKLSQQFRIGVTGEIGAGKSTVTENIGTMCVMTNIDLDQIGRDILTKATDPLYVSLRQDLSRRLTGRSSGSWDAVSYILNADGFIDVKNLSNMIFSNELNRKVYNDLTREPMYLMLREKVSTIHGLVFINSALMAEADVLDFVNNNVILVRADKKIRKERLKVRGYSAEEIDHRMHAQLDADEKLALIEASIKKHGHGKVVVYENNEDLTEHPASFHDKLRKTLDKFEPFVHFSERKK